MLLADEGAAACVRDHALAAVGHGKEKAGRLVISTKTCQSQNRKSGQDFRCLLHGSWRRGRCSVKLRGCSLYGVPTPGGRKGIVL